MASATLSARVNRRGGAASRRRRSFFLRPVRGSGTDISRPSSARESPILPGRWPVRSWYAGGSRSPLCPARTRRAAGRTSGTGPSPVDVGRVGGDIHGIGFPPRPHGSRYLSGGLAAIGVSLPRTGSVAYQAWTDLTAPGTRSRAADRPARSRSARHCAELTTPDVCPVHRRAARQALEGVTMINSGRKLSAGEPLDGNERTGSWSGAATAAAFAYAVRSGRLDLPLPGSGWTRERWAALAALAEEDLSLARLAEGHAVAVAILAELGARPSTTGSRWGVWAAQPPGPGLIATRTGHGWRLDGTKQYCSGARSCTDALVTAAAPDGSRLFAVSTRDLSPVPGSWPATGMAASDTLDVEFTNISAQPVGEPGRYIDGLASRMAARGWPHAGTAGHAASRGRCWPPRPSATWGRTPRPISVPSTSPCIRHYRRSMRRRPRSTRTRLTIRAAAGCGPCGYVRWSRPWPPRSCTGWAARWGPGRWATTSRIPAGSRISPCTCGSITPNAIWLSSASS